MKVSVIILTKNAGDKFELLLDKVYSQKFGEGFEVVVVDSGSVDETLGTAEEFRARIHRIKPGEFHHARTRNLGANLANGHYLVYLSQDAIPLDNDWLGSLITPLEHKEADIVYGRRMARKEAKPMDRFFYDCFYPNKRLIVTKENVGTPKRFCLEKI